MAAAAAASVMCLHIVCHLTGESVYTNTDRSKRRKTADKKAAAAKAAETAAAADRNEPWAIHHRQPWADKEVKAAELNDEQKAFLEQVSFKQNILPCILQNIAVP